MIIQKSRPLYDLVPYRPLYDLVPYRLLYKLGRPTNGLLSEADLDLVDDISWTAL